MNKKIKKYMEEIHKTEQKIADLQQYLKGLHAALKQEEDKKTKERLAEIVDELKELKTKRDELHAKWMDEKRDLEASKQDKIDLEKAKLELERAQNDARYEDAARLQYQTIPNLEKRIKEASENIKSDSLIQETVNEEMIAKVVSRWSGVEVSRMVESERIKLLHLREALGKRVIGQDEALTLAYRSIQGGARGLDMGRNIFQSEHSAEMAQAIRKIVHEGYTDKEAYEFYQDLIH